MSSRDRTHQHDKESTKPQTSQSTTDNEDFATQHQPHSLAHMGMDRLHPSLLSPQDILHLQRTIGNRAVMRMLEGSSSPDRSGMIQREPQAATISKQGGAGIHKSNRKKVASGDAQNLNVRSGGLFRTGIKITVPFGAKVTVDTEKQSEDGNYIWVEYTTPKGRKYVGYINKANVEVSDESDEVLAVVQPPTQVELDIALARNLLDGYLDTHMIGQHMGSKVTNRESLTRDAGTKATEAESWGLRELGVAKEIGKASSERQKEREEIAQQRQTDLMKKDKKEIVDLLIKVDPSEALFRVHYLGKGTSKFDLVKMLVRKMGKGDVSAVAKKDPQKEVWKRPEFWEHKGKELLNSPMSKTQGGKQSGKTPIWCDQSTAIIVATLRDNEDFKSSLTVIRQGDPKQHGHWYVLANHTGKAPAYGDLLQKDEFIIDIWGALRLNEGKNRETDTVVFDTGERQLLNAAVVSLDDDKDAFEVQNRLDTFARFEERDA